MVRVKVYLLRLLRFCQGCCRWHFGSKIDTAFFWYLVKGGAWLRRFDDVTRVEKSCVAKGINRKKAKEK